jgi:hypothetical protein
MKEKCKRAHCDGWIGVLLFCANVVQCKTLGQLLFISEYYPFKDETVSV